MNIEFTKNGWEDFSYWIETDEEIVIKIKELIKSIRQTPFKGLGKPEPLKYTLKGFWSRRITQEHRLVYRVTGGKKEDQRFIIIQCRYHYDD